MSDLLDEAEEKLRALYMTLLQPGDIIVEQEMIVTVLVRAARMTFGTAMDYEIIVSNAIRLGAERSQLCKHAAWMAQTIHQAYHTDATGTFNECPKDVCDSTTRFLDKLNGEQHA
jgi:hypothetical protein